MKLNNQHRQRGVGFTLIELLVDIAIIAILAALLMTSLAAAKGKAHNVVCMNNVRQLAIANVLYQTDHADRFPGSYHGGFLPQPGGSERPWASGWLDWSTAAENTNTVLLRDASYAVLAPYVGQAVQVFQCPADVLLSSAQKARGWTKRVRSISVSVVVGEGNAESGLLGQLYAHPTKSSDLIVPGPGLSRLYGDEHPGSISDPAFFPPNSSTCFVDVPGAYHGRGAWYSFADTHGERRRWRGPALKALPVATTNALNNLVTAVGDPDLAWLSLTTPRRGVASF